MVRTENSPARSKTANSSPASPNSIGSTESPKAERIMQITTEATNSSPPADVVRTALLARCERRISSMACLFRTIGRPIKGKATKPPCPKTTYSSSLLSRSALAMTLTELSAMAAAATMGLSSRPKKG